MTEPCAPINEGIYKKKKPLTFRDFLVDRRESNPRPNEEAIRFLHAYLRLNFRV